MIRHVAGKISHIGNNFVTIDVSGLGYMIYVSSPNSFKLEQEVKLHTHHVVRENISDLYGFTTLDELEIFELLLGLPKIGPKSAAQIMSQSDIELLKTAVTNDDPSHLSKMSGIGKKTAEKVVMGLKDKFAELGIVNAEDTEGNEKQNSLQTDTIDALVALGYPQHDARKVVQKLDPEVDNTNDAIKLALKELGQS